MRRSVVRVDAGFTVADDPKQGFRGRHFRAHRYRRAVRGSCCRPARGAITRPRFPVLYSRKGCASHEEFGALLAHDDTVSLR